MVARKLDIQDLQGFQITKSFVKMNSKQLVNFIQDDQIQYGFNVKIVDINKNSWIIINNYDQQILRILQIEPYVNCCFVKIYADAHFNSFLYIKNLQSLQFVNEINNQTDELPNISNDSINKQTKIAQKLEQIQQNVIQDNELIKYIQIQNELLHLQKKLQDLSAQNGWILQKKDSQVQSHLRYDNDIKQWMGRSEGYMMFEPEQVAQYVRELGYKHEYNPMFESGFIIKNINDSIQIRKESTKGVFPLGKRDFILVSNKIKEPNGTIRLISKSIEHPDHPQQNGYVRANIIIGSWILTPFGKRTHAISIICLDPKGHIPSFLIKQMSKKQGDIVTNINKMMIKKYLLKS